jgi:glycosyltransferase involved in cell wall biosynthesis
VGKKVVIVNGNHLCHNPRVIKEADCLAQAGFDVEVLGAWLNEELVPRDLELMSRQRFRFTPVIRLERGVSSFYLRGLRLRAQRRIAFRAKQWLGIELAGTLGYGLRSILGAARSRDADLYIAHSEPALWVARALERCGKRIGVDMEDWFSRDLLPEARRTRPLHLLRDLEAFVLNRSVHRTSTSQSMSTALSLAYNAFPWEESVRIEGRLEDRRDRRSPSIHWYSQSIGPGRGLEDLFGALPLVSAPAVVHIRGNLWDGYRKWLQAMIPPSWSERVFIHPLVGNDELLSRIAEHDIGVSLDPATPESRDVTVTNKILQYMQAGLAIVATSTQGQREVAAKAPAAIHLYEPGDRRALARHLDRLLGDPRALSESKNAALAAAEDTFRWEKMAPLLVESVHRAIESSR